jgi:hypothetical protein
MDTYKPCPTASAHRHRSHSSMERCASRLRQSSNPSTSRPASSHRERPSARSRSTPSNRKRPRPCTTTRPSLHPRSRANCPSSRTAHKQLPFRLLAPLLWDAEPASDTTLAWSIRDLKSKTSPEKSEAWLSNPPDQWPIRKETAWRGGRFLGAGSFGCAGLWCEVDGAENVVRRMVVKEVRPSGFKWRDPTFWREGLPREIRVHKKVDSSRPAAGAGDAVAGVGAGYANLPRQQGYRLMMQQRRFKLYLDFCAGGDLRAGLKAHFERWKKGQETNGRIG